MSTFLLLSVLLLVSISTVQSQQCVFRRRTENCPRLVSNQTVVPACGATGCYNYCNNIMTSCCARNATSCSVSCPPQGLGVNIVITAGCLLSDAVPTSPTVAPVRPPTVRPTTPPPTVRLPTPPPTTRAPSTTPPPTSRQCVFSRNTQNCPAFVANQAVVNRCGADGCYNYCNGIFINCCPLNANRCSVSCRLENPNPNPIVITAGCRLS